jgi:hypothetical protein
MHPCSALLTTYINVYLTCLRIVHELIRTAQLQPGIIALLAKERRMNVVLLKKM